LDYVERTLVASRDTDGGGGSRNIFSFTKDILLRHHSELDYRQVSRSVVQWTAGPLLLAALAAAPMLNGYAIVVASSNDGLSPQDLAELWTRVAREVLVAA
jgi:hypothetical protein